MHTNTCNYCVGNVHQLSRVIVGFFQVTMIVFMDINFNECNSIMSKSDKEAKKTVKYKHNNIIVIDSLL